MMSIEGELLCVEQTMDFVERVLVELQLAESAPKPVKIKDLDEILAMVRYCNTKGLKRINKALHLM